MDSFSFATTGPKLPTNTPILMIRHDDMFSCQKMQLRMSEAENEDTPRFSTPFDRPVLAFVDMLALLTFAAVGKASHAPDGSIDLVATILVAFPFIVSWWGTSPLTQIYGHETDRGGNDSESNLVKDVLLKVARGWIIAVPLGIVGRGIMKGYVPPLPFIIVTLVATFVTLGIARILFTVLEDLFVEVVN